MPVEISIRKHYVSQGKIQLHILKHSRILYLKAPSPEVLEYAERGLNWAGGTQEHSADTILVQSAVPY
jgi:hypothetical protein